VPPPAPIPPQFRPNHTLPPTLLGNSIELCSPAHKNTSSGSGECCNVSITPPPIARHRCGDGSCAYWCNFHSSPTDCTPATCSPCCYNNTAAEHLHPPHATPSHTVRRLTWGSRTSSFGLHAPIGTVLDGAKEGESLNAPPSAHFHDTATSPSGQATQITPQPTRRGSTDRCSLHWSSSL
jgi:hypothetical protein